MTLSEFANRALEAEKAKEWEKASRLWLEASEAVFQTSIRRRFKEFAKRCDDRLKKEADNA